jgi:DNA-binding winged helix-turn-helix (wHTH) protein/predicted ATPase
MYSFGPYQLDPVQGLRCSGEELRVTPKSLSLLQHLVQRAGEIVTKEQIFLAIWRDTAVSDSALTSCIQELRHVLKDDARQPKFVETMHRRGYRFIAQVFTDKTTPLSQSSLLPVPHSGPIFGRGDTLSEMYKSWLRAYQGSRQLMFVSGEAGLGKTTILSAFLKSLKGSFTIGWGQCNEHFGVGEPYEPLLDAILRLCRQDGGANVLAALEQFGPTWLAQLPALLTHEQHAALERSAAGSTRERMFRELTDVMEAIAQRAPLILCLEDLHWSDPSTVEWISAFARRPDRCRTLMVGTFRGSEVAQLNHPLSNVLCELKAKNLCHEIALSGLKETSISEYVESKFPWSGEEKEAAEHFAALLHKHTDGNPLFFINVVGDLVERQLLVEDKGFWRLRANLGSEDVGIPEDIRQLIEQQIRRLTGDQLALLEIASVAGLSFSVSVIASVSGTSESSADHALSALSHQMRFVRKVPKGHASERAEFEFIHVLYRETLYDRIPEARLCDLHRAVGVCTEKALNEHAPSIAAELAMHFERGQDIPRALFYLERAAENARRRSAFTEAIAFFDRAVKLLHRLGPDVETAEREAVLLTGLGGAVMTTEGWGAARVEAAFSRAWSLREKLGDNPKLFPALWGLWLFYWGRSSLTIASEAANELLVRGRRSGDSSQLLQAHHAGWATAFSRGDLSGAVQHADEGLRLYEPEKHAKTSFDFGNHDPGVCCRSFRARALVLSGRTDEAMEACTDAINVARELAHPFSEALAQVFAASVCQVIRDWPAAKAHATAALLIAREQGFKLLSAWASAFEGWAQTEDGVNDEGLLKMETNIKAARTIGSSQFQTHLLGLLAEAHLRSQRYAVGLQVIDNALEAAHGGERFYEAELYRLRGELLSAGGSEPADVERCFLKACEISAAQKANLLSLRSAINLARLWRQCGRKNEALRMVSGMRSQIVGRIPQRDQEDLDLFLDE